MTNREYHEAVAANNITADVIAKANEELAKLNQRNEKRQNTPSKTAVANEPIKATIVTYLTEHQGRHLAADIGTALGLTTAKASSLCGQLVKAGIVTEEKVKVPKMGTRSAYSIVPTDNAEDEGGETEN